MTPPPSPEVALAQTSLLRAMAAIAPGSVRIGCRVIRDADEAHLLPEEARSLPARQPAMRCASGAARWIAHGLLAEFCVNDTAVLALMSGGV